MPCEWNDVRPQDQEQKVDQGGTTWGKEKNWKNSNMDAHGHIYTGREFMASQRGMCVSCLASRPRDFATACNQRCSVYMQIALIRQIRLSL